MFSPATAEDFLTALKEYFHFPPEYEQTETFVSDIKGFNSRTKLPAAHADSQYSVFSIRTPVAVYLIDRHGSFTTHISIDQEHGFMAHVPAEQMNIQTLHRHTCYELVYILRGSLDFLIEGTHRRYQQGEACLLNTNVRHVEENISDYTAIYLNLDTAHMDSVFEHGMLPPNHSGRSFTPKKGVRKSGSISFPDYIDFMPLIPAENVSGPVARTFYDITLEILLREPLSTTVTDSLIQRLFHYLQSPKLYSCSQTNFQGMPHQTAAEQAFLYLQTHRYKLTREELSAATGYNAGYLNRIFTAHIGQSVTDYNRQIYLNEAANLLLNTTLSVSEISEKLHFESRTAFYEQFRKKYGVTPGEYRNGR